MGKQSWFAFGCYQSKARLGNQWLGQWLNVSWVLQGDAAGLESGCEWVKKLLVMNWGFGSVRIVSPNLSHTLTACWTFYQGGKQPEDKQRAGWDHSLNGNEIENWWTRRALLFYETIDTILSLKQSFLFESWPNKANLICSLALTSKLSSITVTWSQQRSQRRDHFQSSESDRFIFQMRTRNLYVNIHI